MIELDLRQELLAAFEGEYREHLEAMRAVLEAGDVSGAALRDVFRRAHSLKGAARAVDLPRIETIAHELETLLYASVEQARALPPGHVAEVQRGLDSIEAGMRGEALAPGPGSQAGPGDDPPVAVAVELPAPLPDAASRVPALEIERLVDSVRAASDAMLGQEHGRQWLANHLAGLQRLVTLCEADGDGGSTEIARMARTLLRATVTRLREGRYEDWQREQTVSALHAQVERVALVSAESVFGPLAAMARALGREQGQEIEVRPVGLQLLADRPVLQALRDPLIQLLRNAVGHGLGPLGPDEMDDVDANPAPAAPFATVPGAAAPRRPRPRIDLAVSLRSGRLLVEVADNGRGPDLAAIASRARQQGLLPPDAASNARSAATDGSAAAPADEASLLALVFEPGFSTATEVDRLSGRGMGLSIVAEAARRLGGIASMRVRRDAHGASCGTVLCMSVPLAARAQALLLVEAGGQLVALPCDAIDRLRAVPWSSLERVGSGLAARIEPDRLLPVRPLAGLLGIDAELRDEGQAQLVVLDGNGSGPERGLLVDRLREVCRLVVRVPAIVGIDRRLVGGVAMLQDGRPVLVLEPDALRDAGSAAPGGTGVATLAARATATVSGAGKGTLALPQRSTRRRTTILVVDDSITTRTLEKTILQAQGYSVLIAVDGLEALDVLRTADREIDIVVTDVEMPRLDGFGLVAAMRADPRLKAMPLVLMTSRNSQDDIRRGLDLGANAYLTKQEFEQGGLLSVIGQLLP